MKTNAMIAIDKAAVRDPEIEMMVYKDIAIGPISHTLIFGKRKARYEHAIARIVAPNRLGCPKPIAILIFEPSMLMTSADGISPARYPETVQTRMNPVTIKTIMAIGRNLASLPATTNNASHNSLKSPVALVVSKAIPKMRAERANCLGVYCCIRIFRPYSNAADTCNIRRNDRTDTPNRVPMFVPERFISKHENANAA